MSCLAGHESEKSTIITTGMHRSGTSFTAALLQSAGVDLGQRLLGCHESNPRGHFENRDFVEFHRKVLQSQGINEAGYTLQEKIDVEEHYVEEAQQIISENSISQLWGWKDPRTSLFLDFWADLLPNSLFLMIYRSPWEVVDSLYRRGTDSLILSHPELAVKVWIRYNKKLLDFYDNSPERCYLTNIHQVAEDPQGFIEKANAKFKTNLSFAKSEIYDQSLLHKEVSKIPGAALVSHYFPEALDIYRELELRANRIDEDTDVSWFKELNTSRYRIKTFQNWLAIRNLEKERKSIQVELEQTQTQLEQAQAQQQQTQTQLEQTQTEQSRNVEKLINWIQQFDDLVTAMVDSKRWTIGNFLYKIYRKLLFMPLDPPPQEHQNALTEKLRVWEQNYRNKDTQIPNIEKKSSLTPLTNNETHAHTISKSASAVPNFDSLSVDIIVCVHNALYEVKSCLDSIEENTTRDYTLYIINDGSEQETTEYLKTFSSNHKSCVLLENSVAEGYTRAANKGLRASTADYVVLLNSDTVVPKLWLEKFLECGESDSRIGIIGPLSNAASWQSIPECFDDSGDWAVNSLPEGYSVNDFAEVVSLVSEEQFPRVPFINGFCFVVKKTLIETIGYLDEEAFPRGYGEENDYCLRAANAGFELAIADHAYVYHSKSKSYGHKDRKALAKAGGEALWKKHGKRRIAKLLEKLRSNHILGDTRQRVKHYIEQRYSSETTSANDVFSVLFLLPVRGGGGGAHSVVQEVVGMRKLGAYAQIAVKRKYLHYFYRNYPSICKNEEIFYFYNDADDLIAYASQFKVVVATIFHSIQQLQQIVKAHPSVVPAYYIQDYEPWFFEKRSPKWKLAHASYTLIPETVLFAKTQWLCEVVEKTHGVKVEKVNPSLDREVFFPPSETRNASSTVRLAAMIRPSTPRRGADRTMRSLKRVKQRFGEQVVIDIFGCDDKDEKFQQLERDFEFNSHGCLIRQEVAELFRSADIFLDLSDYQAFGRAGLEAMACGCAIVLPIKGGTHDYATDCDNALLVDTTSEDACYSAAAELVSNSDLRQKLKNNAVLKSTEYSISKAAVSELTTLREKWSEFRKDSVSSQNYLNVEPTLEVPNQIRVLSIIPRTQGGKVPGSSYIRLIFPFSHSSVGKAVNLTSLTVDEFFNSHMGIKADVLVVQRTALSDTQTAHKLITYSQQQAIRTVYELDDNLFELPSHHADTHEYSRLLQAA
jgi:GT2 family glycosyltransferase